jgi:alpha-ketoglutarate-dependent taurine dioxygenase
VSDGCPAKLVPILARADYGWTIRYRPDQLQRELRDYDVRLVPRHRDALAALDQILHDQAHHTVVHLEPGDVVLIDNWQTIHGRTALSTESQRLILRVKTRGSISPVRERGS